MEETKYVSKFQLCSSSSLGDMPSVSNGPPDPGGNEAEEQRQENCQPDPARLGQKEGTDLSGGRQVLISGGVAGRRAGIRQTGWNLLKLNLTLSTS